jgi:Na+-transporting methylmalonyl-CoA/oxaloacetate decarboxylase beta subunit
MVGKLADTMKRHRAVVLVLMMLLGIGVIVLLTAEGIANFDQHSLIALGVVIVAAAISGVAFSWKRYSRRS